MKIEYDKKVDAKYISIKEGKVYRTEAKASWLIFDYDKNGDVLGVEILGASKHPISISVSEGDLVGFGEVIYYADTEREFGTAIQRPVGASEGLVAVQVIG